MFGTSEEIVDAFALDNRCDAGRVTLGEHLRVPDLHVVEAPGDHHFALEPRVLAQVLRHGHPALLVGSDLDRAGEEGACGLALARTALAGFAELAGDTVELG